MKFKYTIFGQMLEPVKSHFFTAIIFSFIWLTMIMIWDTAIGSVIFTVIAMVSYLFSLYYCGERAAKDDKKEYIRGYYDLKKCLYIPALLVALNLIFIAIFKLTWMYAAADGSLQKIWGLITSVLTFGWYSPYGSLMCLERGNVAMIGVLSAIILPYLAYFLGYFAVTKNYDISEKLFGFMYEKKKK